MVHAPKPEDQIKERVRQLSYQSCVSIYKDCCQSPVKRHRSADNRTAMAFNQPEAEDHQPNRSPSQMQLRCPDPPPGLLLSRGGGGGEGVLDPKLGVPKMA